MIKNRGVGEDWVETRCESYVVWVENDFTREDWVESGARRINEYLEFGLKVI